MEFTKYITTFETQAAYDAAKMTLDYPNVSLIETNPNTPIFTKTKPWQFQLIDLGLASGTKWADRNLGASAPEGYGKYYAWGDTQGYANGTVHAFGWDNYKWGTEENLTKYNTTDNKTVLDDEDDAAYVATNGTLKMPTQTQMRELMNNTDQEWATINGVAGCKFMKKSDNSVYVFFPAAGGCDVVEEGGMWGIGSNANVWSRSRNAEYASCAWLLYANDGGADVYSYEYGRYYGLSVRGVQSAS